MSGQIPQFMFPLTTDPNPYWYHGPAESWFERYKRREQGRPAAFAEASTDDGRQKFTFKKIMYQ
jgi:hypothetical protein